METAVFLLIVFFGLMLLGMPIPYAMLATSYLTLYFFHPFIPTVIVPQRVFAGVNSWPLLCIPFFMLAGELMGMTSIFDRLLKLSRAIVGHIRGSLSHINVMVSIMFAHMTGSAVADTTICGSILIPAMNKEKYPKDWTVAVTVSSSCLGVIFPPANQMIIAALVTQQSIVALFAAGFIPGAITGVFFLLISFFFAYWLKFPVSGSMTWRERGRAIWESLPAMGIPIVIMGGIFFGVFTPTEAANVAVFYVVLVGIFALRTFPSWKQVYTSLTKVCELVGCVLFCLGAAIILGWIMAIAQVPSLLGAWILSVTTNPTLIIIMMITLFLLVGTFMDPLPNILIFTPIFLPIAEAIGMGRLHFTVVMVYAFIIGLVTPPIGSVLYVGVALSGLSVDKFAKALIPFIVAMIIVCFLMAFIPGIVTLGPRLLGFYVR